ncbi:MAG: CHAT domain-containing protein [Symploca sp. SIO2B6]|nr:CHAT domain-containing protein [Symploca sp. SIO2B6]
MTRQFKRPSLWKRWQLKLARFTLVVITSTLLIFKPLAVVIANNRQGFSESIPKVEVAQGRNVTRAYLVQKNEQHWQSQTSAQPNVKGVISDIKIHFLDKEGNRVQNVTPLDIVQAEITLKPGDVIEQSRLEADLQRIRRLGIAENVQFSLQKSADDSNKLTILFQIIDEQITQWHPWMRDVIGAFKAVDSWDFSSAVEHYEEVLRLVKVTKSRKIESLTFNELGNLYIEQKDYQRAIKAYQQALPILHDLEAHFIELIAWINIAKSYNNLADPERALAAYQKAISEVRLLANNANNMSFFGELNSEIQISSDYLPLLSAQLKITEIMLTLDIATTYSTLGDYQQIIYLVNDSKLLSNSRNLEDAWANIAKNLFLTNNLQGWELELAQIIPKLAKFLSRFPEIIQPLTLRFTYSELGDASRADYYNRKGQHVLQEALEDFRQSISEINTDDSSSVIRLIAEGIAFILDDQKNSQDAEAIEREILSFLETSIDQETLRSIDPYVKIAVPFLLNLLININDSEQVLDLTHRLLIDLRTFDGLQLEPNTDLPAWAITKFRDIKKWIEALLLNMQGEAYLRLEETQQAIASYRQTIELLKLSPENFRQIQQELKLSQEILQVFQLLQPTLEVTQQIPLSDPRFIQQEFQPKLEAFQQLLQSNPELVQQLVQVMDIDVVDGILQANALVSLGKVYADIGELKNARSSYYQALAFWLILGNRLQESETRYSLAQVELSMGNLVEAQTLIKSAILILEDNPPSKNNLFSGGGFTRAEVHYDYGFVNRGNFYLGTGFSSKGIFNATSLNPAGSIFGGACTGVSNYFSCKQRYYDFYINLLTQLDQQYPKAGYNIAAFTASEKSRAGTPEAFSKSDQRILPLNQTAEFTAIQQQLSDGHPLLLEYFLGEKQSYLWVLSAKTSLKTYVLDGRATIEAKAREFYNLLTSPEGRISPKTTAKVGMELTDLILKPIADQLEQKPLLVVADGILQFIPFSALPDPAAKTPPGTVSLEGKFAPHPQPLLLNHEIINLPSASVLARIRQRQANRLSAKKKLAIFANPVFNHADDRAKELLLTTARTTSSQTSVFRTTVSPDITILYSPLPDTQTEMESISQLIKPDQQVQYHGFAASYNAALSSDLSQYRIIHFATHGFFNNRSPNRSGIVLSVLNKTGELQRSLLSPRDTFKMHLPATDLVVLSGCRTGLSNTVRREALTGLTGGLMTAGADRVVVSLWSVEDDVTAELMARFYQNMLNPQQNLSPAQALKLAQISMWNEPRWQAPYYWAAFTIQGEWH